jgi:DUF3054 family protein
VIQVSRSPRSLQSASWAFPLDLVCVLVFVAIGRTVHDHGLKLAGIASTAWPFLSGLAVGWAVVVATRRGATSFAGGTLVCISTVAVGMVFRVVSGQGTAFAFVLVALGFLGLGMVGWRVVAAGFRRMRASHPIEA